MAKSLTVIVLMLEEKIHEASGKREQSCTYLNGESSTRQLFENEWKAALLEL
jgi:hypothetical protein